MDENLKYEIPIARIGGFILKMSENRLGTLMRHYRTALDTEQLTVEEFHQRIVDGTYRSEVEAIRKAYQEGTLTERKGKNGDVERDNAGNVIMEPLADRLKKQLPYFICQAVITNRRLFEHAQDFTGYAPVDIDHLTPEQLLMVMERMQQFPWVKEGHVSCRQEGAHFIVAIGTIDLDENLPPKERKEAYEREYKRRYAEITSFIQQELGLEVDGQCKDVLRGFFVSDDPNAFIRSDEELEVFPFQGTPTPDNQPKVRAAQAHDEQSQPGTTTQSAPSPAVPQPPFNPELVKSYLQLHPYKPSKRHNWWVGFGQYLKWKGVPQNQLGTYQQVMQAQLMMFNHILPDDPCLRSSTEVTEAMSWGFEHSETQQERQITESVVTQVKEMYPDFDDTEFREILRPLVRHVIGLKQSIQGVPDETIMPITIGIMPLLMSYATRVSYRYCDGKTMRLNGMGLIVGPQGSKKSAVKYKIDIWMIPIRESDQRARKKLDAYKEKRKIRKANEKLEPEPTDTIIEVPVTISCSALLKRMKNAKGQHLFSFSEELDTLLKTNGAGSWSTKYDVYRYSCDNAEWGQDYNSDQSESGIVPVAYNWTMLSTYGPFEKCFKGDNVENGLGSRVMLARMSGSCFEYMPTYKDEPQADIDCILQAVDILRGSSGFYEMPRLRKHITQWCNAKADEAREYDDHVLDTFRKRSALMGFRCGVVYHLLEQRETESNNCLAFAELMAEYILKNQCEMLGSMLLKKTSRLLDGTGYRSRNKSLFDELGDTFDWETIQQLRPKTKYGALRTMISKWKKEGLIEEVAKNNWQKKGATSAS